MLFLTKRATVAILTQLTWQRIPSTVYEVPSDELKVALIVQATVNRIIAQIVESGLSLSWC